MDPVTPRPADILDPWLNAYAAERTGRRRDRLLAVGARARACLDAEIDRIATDPELRLIELEHDAGTEDAAARTVGADALPTLLILLTTESWLPADRPDRMAQLQVLGALGRWMSSPRGPWWASYCDVLTLLVEVDAIRVNEHRKVHH
jgi:hypothetical protein